MSALLPRAAFGGDLSAPVGKLEMRDEERGAIALKVFCSKAFVFLH